MANHVVLLPGDGIGPEVVAATTSGPMPSPGSSTMWLAMP